MKNKKSKSPILYVLLRPLGVGLFWIMFRPKVRGRENIPKKGNVVLAGNHTSGWDCFTVISGTRRCIHFLAKKEIFANKFLDWFFKSAGIIPVDRQNGDKAALLAAKDYLNDGCVVGIFPEGTAVKENPHELFAFKMGAVKMAYDTNTQIVPFTIVGEYKFWGKSNVEIIFQPPYSLESDDLVAENDILKGKVAKNQRC